MSTPIRVMVVDDSAVVRGLFDRALREDAAIDVVASAANGEIACSLWCDGDSISLTFRDYDRWKYILPKIVKTFSKIVPGYMAQVPAIHSFAVQYLNEFRGPTAG